MLIFFWLAVLVISFYLLAYFIDEYFVCSLEKISARLKLSSDMAGATLMAIGSSAPELCVSFFALIRPGNHAIIGLGTIVGSALFNLLVITAACGFAGKSKIQWQPMLREGIFYTLSIFLLFAAFYNDSLGYFEALLFLLLYGVYIFFVLYWMHFFPYEEQVSYEEDSESKSYFLSFLFPKAEHYYRVFFISIVYISVLSWLLVESAVAISYLLNISESFIALTVVAVGTSIPDLISSYVVAKRGKSSMAISNAVGSNIFDILIGIGLPLFLVLSFSDEPLKIEGQELFSSLFLLLSSTLLTFALFHLRGWRLDWKSGIILLGIYVFYLLWLSWGQMNL